MIHVGWRNAAFLRRLHVLDQDLAPMQISMLSNSFVNGFAQTDGPHTSNDTNSSALASTFVTCQNMLQACLQPALVAFVNAYVSKSGPPFGNTIIAYTWATLKVSGQPLVNRVYVMSHPNTNQVVWIRFLCFWHIRPTNPIADSGSVLSPSSS